MNGGEPRMARAPCDNKDCRLKAHKSSSSEPLITLATLPRTCAKWRAVVAADVLEGTRHYYSLQFTGMAATAWWWPWCRADVTPTLPISHWADVDRSIQSSASAESPQIRPIRRNCTKGSGHLIKQAVLWVAFKRKCPTGHFNNKKETVLRTYLRSLHKGIKQRRLGAHTNNWFKNTDVCASSNQIVSNDLIN